MYVTGPGGPYSNLNIQAVGTPQGMGGDSFSATTSIISGGSNGDTYQCVALNGVSTPPTNSVQLRGNFYDCIRLTDFFVCTGLYTCFPPFSL